MGSGRARGLGARFIGGKEREGELGASLLGKGRPGEARTAVATRPAVAVASAQMAGARGEPKWCQEGGGFGKTRGARGGLGLGLGTCPSRWPAPAYGVASGRGAGRREVEEPASGNFVNKPKFQNQFCNFKFSPSSWLQMKKC